MNKKTIAEDAAARLETEAQERHLQRLQRELEAQSWLATTGELAGPLVHEFNNFLNIVLLHVTLLEADIPEKLRSELAELRRQGAIMTAMVKQFQQYRRRLQPVQEPIDINQVVLEVARSWGRENVGDGPLTFTISLPHHPAIAIPLSLVMAPDIAPVVGSAADVKRLCTFLLTNAAGAAGLAGGGVTVRTGSTPRTVWLRVEDNGPAVSPELLPQFLEPSTAGRPGTNSLELAACEMLVRRLRGKIRCENRPEGGVAILVELPRA